MKHFYALLLSLCTYTAIAQIGIGTASPHPSAQLEINSNDKGLLIPRVTLANRPGSPGKETPTAGLIVYQTDIDPGFYVYESNNWDRLVKKSEHSHVISGSISYFKGYKTNTSTFNISPPIGPFVSYEYIPLESTLASTGMISASTSNSFTLSKAGTYHISYQIAPQTMTTTGIYAAIFTNFTEVSGSGSLDVSNFNPLLIGDCIVTVAENTPIRVGVRLLNNNSATITIPGTPRGASLTITKLN